MISIFLCESTTLLSMESRITRKGNSYAKRKHIFFYKRVCFLCVFSWWVAWGLGNFLLFEIFLTLSFERGMIGPSSEGVAAAWRDSQHTGFGTVHSKPGLPWNSETHVHSFTVHGGLFFCVGFHHWSVNVGFCIVRSEKLEVRNGGAMHQIWKHRKLYKVIVLYNTSS